MNLGSVAGLTESHVGQIERGEILVSLRKLSTIISATGTSADYILYGKEEITNISTVRKNIDVLLDLSTKEELDHFYRCLTSFKSYKHISKG